MLISAVPESILVVTHVLDIGVPYSSGGCWHTKSRTFFSSFCLPGRSPDLRGRSDQPGSVLYRLRLFLLNLPLDC